jgi:hypothetical protein
LVKIAVKPAVLRLVDGAIKAHALPRSQFLSALQDAEFNFTPDPNLKVHDSRGWFWEYHAQIRFNAKDYKFTFELLPTESDGLFELVDLRVVERKPKLARNITPPPDDQMS